MGKVKRNRTTAPSMVAPAVIAILAVGFLCWQLIGLRYTNHDDIFFQLQSGRFAGNYLDFANMTALGQARPQAYINMPLILWAESLAQSPALDLLTIGTVVSFYMALAAFLASLAGRTNAAIITATSAIFFPLHYYFTFPQGYPAMAAWGFMFCLAAAALLARYLNNPHPRTLAFSAALFFLSLWGPEYNFVLHPFFLLLVLAIQGSERWHRPWKRALATYALTWFAAVVAYLIFSVATRLHGADGIGRVSMGFSFLGWLESFWILLYKSFLPPALIDGIWIVNAPSLGLTDLPALFSYRTMWHADWDAWSAALIFLLFCAAYYVMITRYRGRLRDAGIAIAMLATAIIPPAVVAGSRHYQDLITGGHLQGHLTTFYSQLGLSILLFLLVVAFVQRQTGYAKTVLAVTGTVMLAAFATITVFYNHLNRQAMMANRARWDAVELIARHVHENDRALLGKQFGGAQLWPVMGVSGIPVDNPPSVTYWSAFSQTILGKPLVFTRHTTGSAGAVEFRYFPLPGTGPVVAWSPPGNDTGTAYRIKVVSSSPVAGKLLQGNKLVASIPAAQWSCASTCTIVADMPRPVVLAELAFEPQAESRPNLIQQLFSERRHAFFDMFGRASHGTGEATSSDLVVEEWAPKDVAQGTIPNRQTDGTAAIWVKLRTTSDTRGMTLSIDGIPALETHAAGYLVTGTFPAELFAQPGNRVVHLKNANGAQTTVGTIRISGTPSLRE